MTIWAAEGALFMRRKKYTTKNLKEVCHLGSNHLIQSLRSSLNVETSRFFSSVIRNSQSQRAGGEVTKKICWHCPSCNIALSPICFFSDSVPYLSDEPCNPV